MPVNKIRALLKVSYYFGFLFLATSAQAAEVRLVNYSVKTEYLEDALIAFSRATGINVIYRDKKIKTIRSKVLVGHHTPSKALDILLTGTGYRYEFIDTKTIRIFAEQQESDQDPEQPPVAPLATVTNSPELFEEIISLGTRTRNRGTVTDAPVPIDVFDKILLEKQSFANLTDALQTFIPGLTVFPFPSADGSSLIRPPTFRGLPQDQILVLVNGKRRHRSALVNLIGAGFDPLSQGSQGADMATIPAIAIKRVEVLRDGASAQYGSDAIAGVMNFVLKDNNSGVELRSQYGQFYEGDGETLQVQANVGLPLPQDGFLNISLEYLNANPTSRGRQRTDVQDLIALGLDVPDPAQRWGNADTETLQSFLNGEMEIQDDMRFYMFGNFSYKKSDTSFFYRHPLRTTGIYKSSLYDPGFDLNAIYPNGFTPEFGAEVIDYSQIIGLRGETTSNIYWDASLQYGQNQIRYKIDNTINLSLGNASPSEFRPGELIQKEFGFNLGLTYPWDIKYFHSPLNLAFGFEYRHEGYLIKAGEKSSYETGPLKDLPIGSNGFPGFSPDQAGDFARDNIALYVDLETNITDRLLINLATRFEYYSDSDSTLDSKVALRYQLLPTLALRTAISSGFRAPTPGQSHTANTSTFFESGNPNAIIRGTLPPDHPISLYYGGQTLSPETARNITAGIIWTPSDQLSLTLDYYRIRVQDRIGVSSNFTIEDEDRDFLANTGIRDALTIDTVRFFTNSFTTITEGFDIVGAYDINWSGGTTQFSLGVNYNEQKLDEFDPSAIDREREIELQGGFPKIRSTLSIYHQIGDLSFFLRSTYYDSFTDATPTPGIATRIGAEVVFDLEASYQINETLELSFGGQNIFHNFPDETDQFLSFGLPYSFQSPFGFNGGFWYIKANTRF